MAAEKLGPFEICDELLDGVLVFDQSLDILYTNAAMATSLNLPYRTFQRFKNLEQIFEHETLHELKLWIERLRLGHAEHQEIKLRTRNGRIVVSRILAQRLSGHKSTWMLVLRDLSLELTLEKKYKDQLQKILLQNHRLEIFAFLLLCSIQGSSYIATKFAVETIPPLMTAGIRCLVPGLGILCWTIVQDGSLSWRDWRDSIFQSLLRRTIPQGALTWAAVKMPSGIVALSVSIIPLFLAILESIVGKRVPSRATWIGILLGMFGLALMIADSISSRLPTLETLVLLVALLANAFGTMRMASRKDQIVKMLSLELVLAGVTLLAVSYGRGDFTLATFSGVSEKSILSLVYLVIFMGTMAQVAMVWIMSIRSVIQSSMFLFVVPVIGMILGCTVGKESLHLLSVLASIALLSSVVIIRRSKS
ncbi:MAG: EamA family transporter [Bdellovibrionales bacterium]